MAFTVKIGPPGLDDLDPGDDPRRSQPRSES
jgi:hypothetical protein